MCFSAKHLFSPAAHHLVVRLFVAYAGTKPLPRNEASLEKKALVQAVDKLGFPKIRGSLLKGLAQEDIVFRAGIRVQCFQKLGVPLYGW